MASTNGNDDDDDSSSWHGMGPQLFIYMVPFSVCCDAISCKCIYLMGTKTTAAGILYTGFSGSFKVANEMGYSFYLASILSNKK